MKDFRETTNQLGQPMIEGSWGYAILDGDKVWIPAIHGDMKEILANIYAKWRCERVIFSSILNPLAFEKHLKHIVRKWLEWFPEIQEYVPCIEIQYKAE